MRHSTLHEHGLILFLGIVAVSGCGPKKETLLTSCANHMIMIFSRIQFYLDKDDASLPETTDTEAALTAILEKVEPDSVAWVQSIGAACPEVYARTRKNGYVFVGGGLTARVIRKERALLLFCPSESHGGSDGNAIIDDLQVIRVSNVELIKLLESAVRSGEEGKIPYSKEALSIMRLELTARKRLVRE